MNRGAAELSFWIEIVTVMPQRLQSIRAPFAVKPDRGEEGASGADAIGDRQTGHNADPPASGASNLLNGSSRSELLCFGIVRQPDRGIDVFPRLQLAQVTGESALRAFEVIDEPDFAGDVLGKPRGCQILPAEVEIDRDRLIRVVGYAGDAAFLGAVPELFGVNRAVEREPALAEVDMGVGVGIAGFEILHLVLE